MEIFKAVLCVGGIGLVFGILLAIASKIFYVKKDERLDEILSVLPGANCGGCGYAGCSNLASAIIEGKAKVNGCPVGGASCGNKIAEIMGVAAPGEAERSVACVMCTADCGENRYEYNGINDCVAASMLGGGGEKSCSYACMGLGSCVKACQFGAMSVTDGTAKVDENKCTACGKCVEVCPKKVIKLVPAKRTYTVLCSSKDKGIVTKNACSTGCIACKICEKNCPTGAAKVTDNCAEIDYSKCTACGICSEKCIRKTIVKK